MRKSESTRLGWLKYYAGIMRLRGQDMLQAMYRDGTMVTREQLDALAKKLNDAGDGDYVPVSKDEIGLMDYLRRRGDGQYEVGACVGEVYCAWARW